MTRIAYSKPVPLNSIREKNYCLQNVWSPYNTQNTLFTKNLFPLAFTWPNAKRFEDIYASLVWQRFLFNNNMYVHIGDSTNYQVRGPRDNLRDLDLEVDGYFNVHKVWHEIMKIDSTDAIDFMKQMIKSTNKTLSKEANFIESYMKDLKNLRGN